MNRRHGNGIPDTRSDIGCGFSCWHFDLAMVPHDRSAMIFMLLTLSAAMAGAAPANGAHTPSGSIPPYAKPTVKTRKKKRGAQNGHAGKSRTRPEHIDNFETHELPACPDCGGELVRTGRKRTRIIEDIPEDLKPETTEHTIHRDWCPGCQK